MHETGARVYIEEPSNMSMSSTLGGGSITVELETKIVRKIKTFLEENDITLFFDLEESQIAIERARNILQEYEDVHVELENELGNEEYPARYPTHTQTRTSMLSWIKNAKVKSTQFKKGFSKQISDGFKAEEQFLYKRITLELQNLEHETPILLQDHEHQLSVAEQLISEYTDLFRKIEREGPEVAKVFGNKYDTTYKELNKVILSKRSAIQNNRSLC